ncbi:MAG: inositol monophosphatase family protein [Spirochaetales bacterium]|nr:inositol monophosphatase family protein [Spirochaetales bacterium]
MTDFKSLSLWMVPLAEEAAEIQRAGHLNGGFNIDAKATEFDFVTDIDRRSEELLAGAIQKRFPYHSILAEEGTGIEGPSGYRWVIDPLDGTANYINGLPFYSISIHLEHEGTGLYSLVLAPAMNMRFEAYRGEGAFLNGRALGVSDKTVLTNCILGTGFPAGKLMRPEEKIFLDEFMTRTMGIRRMGSAALDLAFTAAGLLDGVWEFDLNPWDFGGGAFLVEEAGGVVSHTGCAGGSLLIAGSRQIHDMMEEICRTAIK